jgi:hypothetical protein
MYDFLFQPFIVCSRKNIEIWEQSLGLGLGLGWGAMAVGLVHELTRSNVLDYKYYYIMGRTQVLLGQ